MNRNELEILKLIENDDNAIFILSGELVSGARLLGDTEVHEGRRTMRAIRARLTKERAGGDRWAQALVFSHYNDWGDVYIDIETGGDCSL